jgi:hypothetical protein
LLYSSSISAATFYLNCSETSFWVSSFCPCSLSIFCFLSSAFRIFSLSSLFSSSSSFCSVSFLFLSYFNKVSCFASSIDRIISASRWIFRYSFSSYWMRISRSIPGITTLTSSSYSGAGVTLSITLLVFMRLQINGSYWIQLRWSHFLEGQIAVQSKPAFMSGRPSSQSVKRGVRPFIHENRIC